ncbi:MAG: hypothetical protein IJH37_03840 [Clostridia bacterium]|nr:hypothetical protein [Clostridia bacterium]
MKKLYIEPIINTVEFNAENILTASGERVDMTNTTVADLENAYSVKTINAADVITFTF